MIMALHKWVGAAVALYLCLISLSGCSVLFEQEFYRLLSPDPAVETSERPRLSHADLTDIAATRYAENRVVAVWDKKVSADVIAEVWLDGRDGFQRRLLHPYTGADLGPAQPFGLRTLAIARKFHTDLLAGLTGQRINSIGAAMLIVLAMSGLAMWLSRTTRRAQFRRSFLLSATALHRRIGVWIVPFAVMWGVTGLILTTFTQHGHIVELAYAFHTGSGGGLLTRAAWLLCGLLVTTLVVAGLLSWWRKAALSLQTVTCPNSPAPRLDHLQKT